MILFPGHTNWCTVLKSFVPMQLVWNTYKNDLISWSSFNNCNTSCWCIELSFLSLSTCYSTNMLNYTLQVSQYFFNWLLHCFLSYIFHFCSYTLLLRFIIGTTRELSIRSYYCLYLSHTLLGHILVTNNGCVFCFDRSVGTMYVVIASTCQLTRWIDNVVVKKRYLDFYCNIYVHCN